MSSFRPGSIRHAAGGTRRRFLALTTAALAACVAVPAHADKVKIKSEITTAAELNPDRSGRPSPVVLILFQLKSADAFNNADFFALYDPAAAVLGGDLIARTQLTLQPGQTSPMELEFDEEARFVGLVAAFRDIEKAEWRSVVEMPDKGFFKKMFSRSKFVIGLDALAVSASIE